MRANDNGFYIQNNVIINNKLINIDVRYIGDNYILPKWASIMLDNRILTKINDFHFFIPCEEDELYSLLYHIIIQKHGNKKISKHFTRILELLDNITKEKYKNNIQDYLNDINEGAWKDLKHFLIKNQYTHVPKPKDIHVGFYIGLINK